MPELPLFERLQIESSALCNRSCWFCPRPYDRTGTYLDDSGAPVHNKMPTETILDLLDQARAMGFGGRVGFHSYSEPLLDSRNLMLAGEARKRGMRPCLVTNGDVLMKKPELCAEVCGVYDHVVVGLYDYESDSEMEAAKTFWRERLPVRRLEFSTIGLDGRKAHSIAFPRALMPADRRMRAPDLVYHNAPCHRPLLRMIVQHDGKVALCCEDLQADFSLGSIYESSLHEIWQSDHHVRIVHDLLEGARQKYTLCENCPASPTGPAPEGKKIDIAFRMPRPESASAVRPGACSGAEPPYSS